MRLSQSLFKTRREVPADAETRGTQLLIRAGYLHKVGSGLYARLPLLTRTLHKLGALIRKELDPVAQEVSLPALQPAALWRQSGRWDAYRAEGLMFAVQDRAGRELALAPTHEEVAAALAREVVGSYRDLPLSVYQIGPKFRDELRPRAGLLRTREFMMKDGYSFHADAADLRRHFGTVSDAYGRILTRLGAPWQRVEADSGSIGGAGSREFMILSDVGEDELLRTPDGRYAANAEQAVSRAERVGASPFAAFARVHTPGASSVEAVAAALGCAAGHVVKTLLYTARVGGGPESEQVWPVLVCLRGDHSLNPVKLRNAVAARVDGPLLSLEAAAPGDWTEGDRTEGDWAEGDWAEGRYPEGEGGTLPLGFVGPDLPDTVVARRAGVRPEFLRLCDVAAAGARGFVAGANEAGWHVAGADWDVTHTRPEVAELRQARAGEASVHDLSQRLESARGIEVGHVFQLGTRYTAALGATFTAADGREQPLHMGCYGIGVTRLAQALAEVWADDRGLVWPAVLAPHTVMLTVVDPGDPAQREAAESLYAALRAAGLDPLLDDRDVRPGVKFADADLVGLPWRVTVGRHAVQGEAELTGRRSGETQRVRLAEVVNELRARLAAGLIPG
ncbi:proline--tRNA ligase [Deinococcus petrolearius]|uniref:Proline--tRNA ligase n=1 Tax=Deinococcus petrolearius TaxID=1751295 RepID=A0ABW1DK44_9DEIO